MKQTKSAAQKKAAAAIRLRHKLAAQAALDAAVEHDKSAIQAREAAAAMDQLHLQHEEAAREAAVFEALVAEEPAEEAADQGPVEIVKGSPEPSIRMPWYMWAGLAVAIAIIAWCVITNWPRS